MHFYSLFISFGFATLFLVYALGVDEDTQCFSNSTNFPLPIRILDSDVNVSFRFQLLLILGASTFILDVLRSLFAICFYRYLHLRDYHLKNILTILVTLLHLTNLVLLHLFRLSHSGRVCTLVLQKRGRLLWGLLITIWSLLGGLGGLAVVAVIYERVRKGRRERLSQRLEAGGEGEENTI